MLEYDEYHDHVWVMIVMSMMLSDVYVHDSPCHQTQHYDLPRVPDFGGDLQHSLGSIPGDSDISWCWPYQAGAALCQKVTTGVFLSHGGTHSPQNGWFFFGEKSPSRNGIKWMMVNGLPPLMETSSCVGQTSHDDKAMDHMDLLKIWRFTQGSGLATPSCQCNGTCLPGLPSWGWIISQEFNSCFFSHLFWHIELIRSNWRTMTLPVVPLIEGNPFPWAHGFGSQNRNVL